MSVSLKIVLRKKNTKDQTHPVKLRVTNLRKSNYIALGIHLSDKDFNKLIKGKKLPEDIKKLRAKVINAENKAQKIIEELPEYSFKEFKSLFQGIPIQKVNKSLVHLFNSYIARLEAEHRKVSANNYKSTLKHIKDFIVDIEINKIDKKLLGGFKNYLLGTGLSSTTARIYLITFKAVINANNELIDTNPFIGFQLPKSRDNKRAIPMQDLKKLLEYNFQNQKHQLYIDLFRFSFYCAGINIKDILLLKESNINGDYIEFIREKTKHKSPKLIRVFILDEARNIIRKYNSESSAYLFPVLSNEDSDYLFKTVNNTVLNVNRRLKKACNDIGIQRVMTYHARHTYATTLMNKGISIAFISSSLGHANIATTQHYLGNFTDKQMEANMKKLI
ncbi:site-specific integrase [Lentimicrobium sp. L6]|uniref:site-specific integrase n=1 Tax=Lentimicrobium sp. L6 TaxID=2735916 RepID=UPI0015521BFF|nr:site-specific integrase [Lentimicrobium sp. L6]NPD84557.1 site-specific integrase [Lentimicrobium sp. L6]